jgi:hypothetical protein
MSRDIGLRMGTSPPCACAPRDHPRAAWVNAKFLAIAALCAASIAARPEALAAFDERCRMPALEDGTPPSAPSACDAGLGAKPDVQKAPVLPGSAPRPTLEYQVKAAFLLSFATFTEWPVTAFESASSPVRICVVGDDPFEGSLVRTVEGESVAGHPLAVTAVGQNDDVSRCHLVFVSRSADAHGIAINRGSAESPVLIVGESDALWRNGAIIRFAIDQGRVRFDVNRTAAEQSGLRLSSKLLRIARLVR